MTFVAWTDSIGAQTRNRDNYEAPPKATRDTNEIYVELGSGIDPEAFAKRHGITYQRTFMSNANQHVFETRSVAEANALVAKLSLSSKVDMIANNRRVNLTKLWAPNDPYFANNRLGGQWHLQNDIAGSGGVSANAMGAWAKGFTGSGVNIGIVDDGFEYTHPDLATNYNPAYSYDFGQMDADPFPVTANDRHGTSVTGIANAVGGNGIGVTGAAPLAKFSGIRLDFNVVSEADIADATSYQSQNLPVKNHSYGVSSLFTDIPLVYNAITSSGQDTIHVYAAGNSRLDVSKQHIANNVDTIMVGAVGWDGVRSVYTQYGASIMAVASTSDHDFFPTYLTTTTDRLGANGYNDATGNDYNAADGFANPANYTGNFGGTSSAAPLMTGVLALAKEANPNMNTRIAKHLLVMTSQKTDLGNNDPQSDGGWRANGAGHLFNHNYGFGVVDADALVSAAQNYTDLSALTTENTGTQFVNREIDTNANNLSLTETFNLTSSVPLEDLLVTLDFDHDWRGDLEAYVTSPSGFRSRLFRRYGNDDYLGHENWTFRSVAFWGEDPQGTWEIELIDTFGGEGGTWNWFSVEAHMGTLSSSAIPEPSSMIVVSLMMIGLMAGRRRRRS